MNVNIKKIIVDKHGKRYLPIHKCGIHPLILMTECEKFTMFQKEKTVYISLEGILRIYKNELKYNTNHKNIEIIQHNIQFLEKMISEPLRMNREEGIKE